MRNIGAKGRVNGGPKNVQQIVLDASLVRKWIR